MQPVFSAEEMRRLDARAVDSLGIPGAVLMENAGRQAASAVRGWLGQGRRGARVEIVCGKGGNGGDGFVVARHLRRAGLRPRVWLAWPAREIRGAAAAKLGALARAGIRPQDAEGEAAVRAALAGADVIVDALLGTGARGAPGGLTARLIELMNASGRPIVALDIPSGVSADGGPAPDAAVRAALTVTFAGLKRGLLVGPGAALAGRVTVVPIGIPEAEVRRGVTTFLAEATDVAPLFPPRPREAHKGSYGHLLVVGGARGTTGAAAMAGRAAMRAGAGLVTLAVPASQQSVVAALTLEGMTAPLPETGAASPALAAVEVVASLAAARDAVALGPGLGLDGETQAAARRLVAEVAQPMVVDADALTALAGHLAVLGAAPAPRVLTPHPGEMARMLGVSVAEVQRDRLGIARELARAHGAHLVLKGALSVIAHPDGRLVLNPTGNPGMASGGMGDVLTGMAGAMLARGFAADTALLAAVYLHGLAGDLAAARVGEEALIAGDVIEALPGAFAALSAVAGTSPPGPPAGRRQALRRPRRP